MNLQAYEKSRNPELAGILRAIVGTDAVITDEEALRPFECDGLTAYRELPLMVVLPSTVDEVQQVMNQCALHSTPVVTRGAGTGLSGGALPISDGVLLSLTRMDQILEVNEAARTARVQPGVRNLAISEAVRHLGLYYAPDPSSQIACSIGGNVAENSGGVHCLKYGLTVHNILQLKVVTVNGELIEVGSEALDSPGYDLLALMTGSEGMLGVVVEVVVKLLPIPPVAQVVMAAFDEVDQAGNAVAAIIGGGILPAGLEMMDSYAITAVEDFVHAGYPVDAAAILLCELDGTQEEVDAQISKVERIMAEHGATDTQVAADEETRQRFWSGRKAAFPAVGRISPDYYCIDGTIPRRELGTVLTAISELSEQFGLRVANVFHAGDGNLHPLILYDASQEGELEKTEELGNRILELCVKVGGTITGEHGVGVEKLRPMCLQFEDPVLEQFHAVKAAWDPENLLNPGKAVPTLARCAEFGAMHVHHGNLPFDNLERF
ncbi:MAG: FAD-binding protein [Acidiferrobacterales bacterium]|nr:FAD-binding protein [Acidiferrobacterales bacterium]